MRIGIDLGGTKTEFIALGDDGAELCRWRVPTPAGDYDAMLGAIVDGVAAIERETGRTGSVGMGIPGAISPRTGLVKNANSQWLNGRPLDRDLEATNLGTRTLTWTVVNLDSRRTAVPAFGFGRAA